MRRWRSTLAAAVITAGVTVAMPSLPAAADTADVADLTPAQRAAAIATPAMVRVETSWKGRVRNLVTGELVDDRLIQVSVPCAGVGVGSDGYLATASQCVDLSAATTAFYREVAQQRVAKGLLTADQTDAFLTDLGVNAVVVGETAGAAPARTVTIRREVAPDDTLPATVVSGASSLPGGVAIMKIEKSNQPLLPLANPSDVSTGREVVTVEYHANATEAPPTARTGSIAATTPVLIAYAGPNDTLPGSPVLTLDGEIAGFVSHHQPVSATDVLAPVSAAVDELKKNQVSNDQTALDNDYRAGLDAFYGGRYTDSIEKFDAVLAIIPSHQQAHAYREQAQSLREAAGPDRDAESSLLDSASGWLGGAMLPLAAAAIVVALALILVRRRVHHEAPESAETPEPGGTPEPAETPELAETPEPAGTPAKARSRIATPTYCTNCSTALPDDAAACPLCGEPVRAVRV